MMTRQMPKLPYYNVKRIENISFSPCANYALQKYGKNYIFIKYITLCQFIQKQIQILKEQNQRF